MGEDSPKKKFNPLPSSKDLMLVRKGGRISDSCHNFDTVTFEFRKFMANLEI